jgi:hypothetical protein
MVAEDDENSALIFNQKVKRSKKINENVAEELYARLAREFVKSKVEKLNCCSRFYLYLQ